MIILVIKLKNLKINFGSINKDFKKTKYFFAIKEKNDGNLFIKNAFNKQHTIVNRRKDKNINQNKQIMFQIP